MIHMMPWLALSYYVCIYIYPSLSLSHIHEDPVFAVAGLGLLAPPLLLGGGWCGGASRNLTMVCDQPGGAARLLLSLA